MKNLNGYYYVQVKYTASYHDGVAWRSLPEQSPVGYRSIYANGTAEWFNPGMCFVYFF